MNKLTKPQLIQMDSVIVDTSKGDLDKIVAKMTQEAASSSSPESAAANRKNSSEGVRKNSSTSTSSGGGPDGAKKDPKTRRFNRNNKRSNKQSRDPLGTLVYKQVRKVPVCKITLLSVANLQSYYLRLVTLP